MLLAKINKNGKMVNVNYASGALQDRMVNNGWRIELMDNCNESAQGLYDRLAATGLYKDIKVYYCTTAIRGLHKYVAFVKK